MRLLFSVFACIGLLLTQETYAQDKMRELDSIALHWQALAKFNGTVLVAQHGKPILYKGYGIKAVEQGNIDPKTTLYMIGGMTEMFTAGVIFKLQEEKRLSIEDTIAKYLPDYPNGNKIKIKHLLTHQSGIPDYMNNDSLYNSGISEAKSRDFMQGLFKNSPLAFEPGKGFMYSTSNFYLLGNIIEEVTDTSYYAAIRKYIFEPLGIENSGFNYPAYASWDKAQGYSILNTMRYIPAYPPDSTIGYAAAGIFTSAEGLYKWSNAFLNNKLLKKSSWKAMTTEQGNEYGYGWEVTKLMDKLSVGHTGETFGFVNALNIIPEDSTIILVMCNDFESEVYRIRDDLAAALYSKPYQLPKKREAVFLEDFRLGQYAGRYEFENGMDLNVTFHDKMLWGQINGQQEFTMLADLERDVFFMSSADVEFYFIREKGTRLVTDIIIRQNRKEIKGHKWQ